MGSGRTMHILSFLQLTYPVFCLCALCDLTHVLVVDLTTLVYDCFICDINALKPGNVGRHGAGHGMDCADFIKSAQVVTPILCNRRLGLGKRILSSVEATLGAVHCNTNLGMVLLIAPIIRVFEQLVSPGDFQDLIKPTLMSLEQQEAQDIFAAIRLAQSGRTWQGRQI